MNCPTCGAPTKGDRYTTDLGTLLGFEAGMEDSKILRESVYTLLMDDEKYRDTPNLWRHAIKKRLKQLRLETDFDCAESARG